MKYLFNTHIILTITALCFLQTIAAQDAVDVGSPYIRNYIPKNYKADPQNWSIVQDKRGIMYFGNTDGVLEYDGNSWKVVPADNKSIIRSLSIDKNGTVLVGGSATFGYLASDSSGALRYVSLSKLIPDGNLSFNDVWQIHPVNDGVYFLTNEYVFFWDEKSITVIPAQLVPRYGNVVGDKLFVALKQGGLGVINNKQIDPLPYSNIINSQAGTVLILPSEGGKLFVVTEHLGFYIYDYQRYKQLTDAKKAIPDNVIQPFASSVSLYTDFNGLQSGVRLSNGQYVFGTINGGFAVMEKTGQLLKIINKARGLQNNNVHALYIDNDSTFWAALDAGISKIATVSPITSFNEQNNLEGVNIATFATKNVRYSGTADGLFFLPPYQMNLTNDKHVFHRVTAIRSSTWDIYSVGNTLLAATSKGGYLISDTSARLIFDIGKIYSFGQSVKYPNELFVGLYTGLASMRFALDGAGNAVFNPIKVYPEMKYPVWNMVGDTIGDVWMASLYNGVFQLHFNGNGVDDYTIHNYTDKQGLPSDYSHCFVHHYQGNIYVATPKGIYKAVGSGGSYKFEPENTFGRMFTIDNPSNLRQVYVENPDRVWVNGGGVGIGYISKGSSDDYQWHPVPFKSRPTYIHKFYIENGIAMICTDEGLFRYDPSINETSRSDFYTLVRRVTIGRDSVVFNGFYYNNEVVSDGSFLASSAEQPNILKPVLDYAYNSLIFDFTATSFQKEEDNMFSYKLEGFDKEWSLWENKHSKEYTNLSAGKYTFRVKARNLSGVEGKEAAFSFEIQPPWYRTIFAYIAYILLFVGIVYFSVKLYSRRLEQANQRLEETVERRTAEVQQQKREIEHKNQELEKLSIVASETDNAVVIMDAQANFEWFNEGFTRLYGYTFDEWLQKYGNNMLTTSQNPEVQKAINSCIKDKKTNIYETVMRHKNGSHLWSQTTLTPILDKDGNITKLVAIDSDITKMKEAEQQLIQKSEEIAAQAEQLEITNRELEKLSIVARETDNAVLITDAKGNFEWVNESFTRMFGFTLDQLVREKSTNLIGHNTKPHVREIIERCINECQSVQYEMLTHRKNGDKLWIHATLTPVLNAAGNLSQLVVVDSDITRIKLAEAEILQQKEEIEAQRDQVERQNEQIRGSIRYAKTIQSAILPIKEDMDKFFDSFVIYRPKDIVSGDFYWFSYLSATDRYPDTVFMAVVDCTGHGVPGAFMSMISNRVLNSIVNEKENLDPGTILGEMDLGVKRALKQDQTDNNDGMDVSICRFQMNSDETFQLTYAGAKLPVYYFNSSSKQITVVEGDRNSIGGMRIRRRGDIKTFVSKQLTLQKGDCLYLSSDGMIDQNTSDRRRFGTTKFLDMLQKATQMPFEQQKEFTEKTLDSFMKGEEQRDDISLVGIQLGKKWVVKS